MVINYLAIRIKYSHTSLTLSYQEPAFSPSYSLSYGYSLNYHLSYNLSPSPSPVIRLVTQLVLSLLDHSVQLSATQLSAFQYLSLQDCSRNMLYSWCCILK